MVESEWRQLEKSTGPSEPAARGILFPASISYLDETPVDRVEALVTLSDSIMDTPP